MNSSKRIFYLLLLVFLILGSAVTIHKFRAQSDQPQVFSNADSESEQAPAWLSERYYYPLTGEQVARQRYAYLKKTGSLRNLASQQTANQLKKRAATAWENIGPFGLNTCPLPDGRNDIMLSGRIISLGQDYGNPNIMYLGAASGGLWKSKDRGKTWENILDDLAHPSVSAIATNPGKYGDVWIGTGDNGDGVGGEGAPSMGLVYHSTNYGERWEQVTISSDYISWVSKIIIRPAARNDLTDVIFISTDKGIFRSENGVDWVRVLYGRFSDVVYVGSLFAIDYKVVVAEHWGSRLWYSDNKGLPGSWTTRVLPGSAPTLGRITLSASLLGFNTKVYANAAARGNTLDGIYRSDNGGDTWQMMTRPYTGGQMNYNNTILMDDEPSGLTVYTGTNSRELWRSLDGGVSWTTSYDGSLGVIHEDQHVVFDDVSRRGTIYVANDGGLYKSVDRGQTFAYLGNRFLSIAQIYNLTISPEIGGLFDGSRYYIATQDNGVQRGPNEFLQWHAITCCDGGDIAFKDGIQYSTLIGLGAGNPKRLQHPPDANPCQPWVAFTQGLPDGTPWGSKLVYNGHHFYLSFNNPAGGEAVWRAENGALPWRNIGTFSKMINTMGVSPDNIVVAGIADPKPVRVSDIANTTFAAPDNSTGFYENKRVTDIDFGRLAGTDRRIYATLSGISGKRVIMSLNSGRHFVDITGDLPDQVNARCVLVYPYNNNIIYIGSDLGVFVTSNGGFNWIRYSEKLPAVCYVNDLEYDHYSGKIVAATYGRGVFITDPLLLFLPDIPTIHTATPENITANWTTVENPLLNNTPDAMFMVTQNWNPGEGDGIYNSHEIGVWYDDKANKWAIFNQDRMNMTEGAAFNLYIPAAQSTVFAHKATASNINGNYTAIDHPLANDNPDAIVMVTQNWNPGDVGGTYNDHSIGVWYYNKTGRWNIFNQNRDAMPEGAAFNVFIPDKGSIAFSHRATTSTIVDNSTFIDDPSTNNNPGAILFVTQNWNPGGAGNTYNDHAIGVRYDYDRGKWAIFNQDFKNMPEGAAFNVFIPGTSPATTAPSSTKVPLAFRLEQNYPNPFNPTTTIRYSIEKSAPVTLSVFDMMGRVVRTFSRQTQQPGHYQVEWDGRNDAGMPVASGVYLYRLQVGAETMVRKMVLTK